MRRPWSSFIRGCAIVVLALMFGVGVFATGPRTSNGLAFQRYQMAYEPMVAKPTYDGNFIFTRAKYPCGGFSSCYYYKGMPSWAHGMPDSEINLVKILGAISTVSVRSDVSNVIEFDDPQLMKFPIVYMTEASFWTLTDKAAAAFGAYLQKGGFAIFDDFRNDYGRSGGYPNFATNMRKVLPNVQFADLTPAHPIFHCFFDIPSFDVVKSAYDGGRPIFQGIYQDNDPNKRLMAIINFNTDVSEYWEFSATGFKPVDESNEAFKLGVNYIIYGLTH